MPWAPPSSCEHAGCNALVYDHKRKCPKHRKGKSQLPSASSRGYNARYRRNRIIVLEAAVWKCHYCGGTANEVDHVVALADGGGNELSNLRACCRQCNQDRKQERARRRRAEASR